MRATVNNPVSRFAEIAVACSAESPSVWNGLELLDGAEIDRYAELRRHDDRRRFFVSRKQLRSLLSRVATPSAEAWRFFRAKDGAWKLADGLPDFAVSTAHSEDAVAVAVSNCKEIGIDIERLDTDLSQYPIDVALSTEEKNHLSALPPKERDRAAIRFWTAKEAYSKLMGVGVDLDFANLDFSGVQFFSQEVSILRVPYQVTLAYHSRNREDVKVGFSEDSNDGMGGGGHGTHASR